MNPNQNTCNNISISFLSSTHPSNKKLIRGPDTRNMAELEIFKFLGLKERSERRDPDTPRILTVLASILEKTIHRNERLNQESSRKENVTIFHGSRAPSMSIQQYIERIYKYTCCSPSCFVMAHVYIQNYLKKTEACLDRLNVHRLVITCVMVAAKFMDDECYDNAYYAKVGGVSKAEMNRLELKLLFDLDFGLKLTKEAFHNHCLKMQKEAGRRIKTSSNLEPSMACCLREERTKRFTAEYGSKVSSTCSCRAI